MFKTFIMSMYENETDVNNICNVVSGVLWTHTYEVCVSGSDVFALSHINYLSSKI